MLAEPLLLEDAVDLMRRETRRRMGRVPETLGGKTVPPGRYETTEDEILLRGEGFAINYRRGEGVTIDLDSPEYESEAAIYLDGTIHAAIASFNRLYPLHASAIAVDGMAMALAGPSGAGKSALAAALGKRGFPLVCDDTLVIDPSGPRLACLPGHKRLKLWPEGLALAGVQGGELVSKSYPKFYVGEEASDCAGLLPLGAVLFLEQAEQFELVEARGAERFALFEHDHYTDLLHAQASRKDAKERFALKSRLAREIPVWRFRRPFDSQLFETGAEFLSNGLASIVTS